MKRFFLIISIIASVFLASCSSTFFYSTLQTTNEDVTKVENGDFLYENDSLWIAHCFKGEDAPIQITVFNKLDTPLYVDWSRSALILNNRAYPYSRAGTYTEILGSSDYASHNSIITSAPELSSTVSFIPPKSMVSEHTLRIAAQFDEINNNEYTKAQLATSDGQKTDARRIAYDYSNSPLHFASYITVYTDPKKSTAYRTDFYATNLLKTKLNPEYLPANMADRGDIFYQQKRPNNTGWHILGSVAVVAGVTALDVFVLSNDRTYCDDCY